MREACGYIGKIMDMLLLVGESIIAKVLTDKMKNIEITNKIDKISISIIIPVHNGEQTISRCLESIIDQKYENLECIIVENNSCDSTLDLCKKYERKNSFIKVLTTDIKGVSNARNIGLDEAKNDIIIFCDADDILEENALNIINEQFNENKNIECLISGYNVGITKKNKLDKQKRVYGNKFLTQEEAIIGTLADNRFLGFLSNKFYKREVIGEKRLDVSLSFCEDMHFNIGCLTDIEDNKIRIIDNTLMTYMDNPNSVTHQMNILFDEKNELKYIVSLKRILKDFNLNKKEKEIVRWRIACLAIDCYRVEGIKNSQRKNLHKELKENYVYLLKNIYRLNIKHNIKQMIEGLYYLISN